MTTYTYKNGYRDGAAGRPARRPVAGEAKHYELDAYVEGYRFGAANRRHNDVSPRKARRLLVLTAVVVTLSLGLLVAGIVQS